MKFFFLQKQITNHFKFKTICRGRALLFTLEKRHFLSGVPVCFLFPKSVITQASETQW